MKKMILLGILLVATQAHAIMTIDLQPEMKKYGNADWGPFFTGLGLIIAPWKLKGDGVDFNKAIELEGWSYAATDIIDRFLPKQGKPMAPVMVTLFNVGYRLLEDGGLNSATNRRKLLFDELGVLGRVEIEIKF